MNTSTSMCGITLRHPHGGVLNGTCLSYDEQGAAVIV